MKKNLHDYLAFLTNAFFKNGINKLVANHGKGTDDETLEWSCHCFSIPAHGKNFTIPYTYKFSQIRIHE